MDETIRNILNSILDSHKNLENCTNLDDLLRLIHKKPPFYYQKKENIVREFLDCLVDIYGSVDSIAQECGVSVETIKKVRNGTRFPSKILWVKIGLSLKIPPQYCDLFMMAAGYSLNTIYIEDVYFYYGMVNQLSCEEVYYLLDTFVGEKEANDFFSP